MIGQQQGPNQIESPANLLQQPHNYDVQVRFSHKLKKKNKFPFLESQTLTSESYANKIYTKFAISNIDSCARVHK